MNKCRRRKYRTSRKYFVRRKSRCRCFYCTSNRQYSSIKRRISAEEKIREYQSAGADFLWG